MGNLIVGKMKKVVIVFHSIVLLGLVIASTSRAGDRVETKPWPARPLMSGNWQYASPEQVTTLRQKFHLYISPEERPLVEGISRLRALPLSCHEDVILFEGETQNSSGQSGVVSFLLHKRGVTLLDGKAERLHALNAWNPVITRTNEQAETYLKLFSGAITGEESNFRILQTPEEIAWSSEAERESHQEIVEKMKPLELKPNGDSWKGWAAAGFKDTELGV